MRLKALRALVRFKVGRIGGAERQGTIRHVMIVKNQCKNHVHDNMSIQKSRSR